MYLTIKETCEYLKMGKTMLGRLIKEKEIPVTRIGNKMIRIDTEDIAKYMIKLKDITKP